VETVGVEDAAGDLLPRHAVRDLDQRLLGERLLQPPLHAEPEEERRDEECEIEHPTLRRPGS